MTPRAFAASVTPLRGGGDGLDEEAFAPLCSFLADGGVDGILALGTTGEGMLLTPPERRRALELFLAAAAGRLEVIAHCGAQSTADTVTLCAHAAEQGASAVAVIAPPYFVLDPEALLAHLLAAAGACAPTPFFVYEFERASGYAVPPEVVARLRERAPNLAGLKVSDTPFERVSPYLTDGLALFVGAESLIHEALEAGAAGAVSGLAAAFPDAVARAVREGTAAAAARVGSLRAAVERFPRHAALKAVLALRGVPIREDVRAPLRGLTPAERAELESVVDGARALL